MLNHKKFCLLYTICKKYRIEDIVYFGRIIRCNELMAKGRFSQQNV